MKVIYTPIADSLYRRSNEHYAQALALALAASCRMLSLMPLPFGRLTSGLSVLPMTNTFCIRVAKSWPASDTMRSPSIQGSPFIG